MVVGDGVEEESEDIVCGQSLSRAAETSESDCVGGDIDGGDKGREVGGGDADLDAGTDEIRRHVECNRVLVVEGFLQCHFEPTLECALHHSAAR